MTDAEQLRPQIPSSTDPERLEWFARAIEALDQRVSKECRAVMGKRFLQIIRAGASRDVLLIGPWAIKVPKLSRDGAVRAMGRQANRHERRFSARGWPELCPVVFATADGQLLIMRRADPLPTGSLTQEAALDFFCPSDGRVIPGEPKESSLGLLEGRMVILDYGEGGE